MTTDELAGRRERGETAIRAKRNVFAVFCDWGGNLNQSGKDKKRRTQSIRGELRPQRPERGSRRGPSAVSDWGSWVGTLSQMPTPRGGAIKTFDPEKELCAGAKAM